MNSELLLSLLSTLVVLFIGIMAKFSVNDNWQPLRKYWIYFIIMGLLSLLHIVYKYCLK